MSSTALHHVAMVTVVTVVTVVTMVTMVTVVTVVTALYNMKITNLISIDMTSVVTSFKSSAERATLEKSIRNNIIENR